jgi:hypothetical protein
MASSGDALGVILRRAFNVASAERCGLSGLLGRASRQSKCSRHALPLQALCCSVAEMADDKRTYELPGKFLIWAIVAAADGFHIKEIPVENIGSSETIALHFDKRSAKRGLSRVRLMMSLGNSLAEHKDQE